MRALSKLVNLNTPDLVLFVGEALVGNDVVDQLSKFNKLLILLNTEEISLPRLFCNANSRRFLLCNICRKVSCYY
ncbi:hypothetical protein ACE6H2_010449 [Prunus campanulata]